jgi:serine/threonine-protein kinase
VQTRLQRNVALKLLTQANLDDVVARRRFLREAQALASLNHPNVVRVLAFDGRAATPYLVMEYLAGGTLRDRLGRGPLSPAAARRVACELLDALSTLHGADMIHRDVKPSNVLFRDAGQAVLGDLGIVALSSAEITRITATGEVVGTLAYVAPEAFRTGELTPRSDLFSLGVTLYESITGKHPTGWCPFSADFRAPDPRQVASACPEDLARLVVDMLAVDPDARPASAADGLRRLEQRPGTPGGAASRARDAKGGRPPRRSVPVAAAIAFAFALGIAAPVALVVLGARARLPAPRPPEPAGAARAAATVPGPDARPVVTVTGLATAGARPELVVEVLSTGPDGLIDPGHIFISVSPHLSDSRAVTRS